MHPQVANSVVSAQILTGLCEGLFVYDPYTCKPVPALAESWTENGKTWKFQIRKNAKFENGDLITAHTIQTAWLNILDPKVNYPFASLLDCIKGAQNYRLGKNKDKNSVAINVENDFTLIVTLTVPTQHFAKILCHHAFSAVHPTQLDDGKKHLGKYVLKNSKNAFIPISNGPFKVETYNKDLIKFVKNPKYWDKDSVELDVILIKMNMKPDDITDAFNRGEIHWTNSSANINDIVGYNTIQYSPGFSTEYLFFKVEESPLNNAEFRKALLLAIPYKELRKGYLLPASTLIFPLIGYPKIKGIEEYNKPQAKQIIEKLNLNEKDKTVKIKFPDTSYHKELANILKNAWTEIGLQVELDFVNYSKYYPSIQKSGYHLATMTWVGDFADPIAFLELFKKSSGLNDSKWKNDDFEKLIMKANSEYKQKERYELLAEAEQILLDSSVIIPISHSPSINIIDLSTLSGWYSNPLNIHPFKFIKFVPPKMLPGIVKR
ncbi:MAG: ABC transporter substrate-binding protein [Treponema sp.]|nr:MAG: ABC transporter substrate-binding protein [Treponema sp.]